MTQARQDWISGRFRGVYASERAEQNEGTRRLPIQLQYGELADARPSAEPPADEAADELRFAKLLRVKIASAESGAPGIERALFDVRIRAWRLLYPAESARRIYGTLVGELTGRLAPLPVEPQSLPVRTPEPAASAPAPPSPSEPKPADPVAPLASAPAPMLPPAPPPPAARPDDTTPEQDLERLLWVIVPGLLCVLGAALALACGPKSAGIWLAPLAVAIALRQTPSHYRIQGSLARRWFGGLCVLAQLFVLLAPLQIEWTAGCRPSLRAALPLLAAPLVATALVRTQSALWICAVLWTTALAAWCGGLDGNCTAAALAAPARSVAPAPHAPARTDSHGRWPAPPQQPAAHVAPERSAVSPASDAATDARSPESTAVSDPGAALGATRISLDQASRNPDAFFKPDGPRLYIPSDGIFEPNRPQLRSEGEATLAQLAQLLVRHPERRVVIEIHTDASSDAATQRALGRERAQALANWLVRRGGLKLGQFRFQPLGAAQPLVPPDGDYLEQRSNRRLELRLDES